MEIVNLRKISIVTLILSLLFVGINVLAQETPAVTVNDQFTTGVVTIESVTSDGDGWLVVHADNGEGVPGAVIGFAPVADGVNNNVLVQLDTVNVTSTLFAMLHTDTGETGVYEFGTVEGADGPVVVDDVVVSPAFEVAMIEAGDQLPIDNTVTVPLLTIAQDGWLVVHADNGEGAPGPVLGQTAVLAGTSANVVVALDDEITSTVFPMLHVDTGEAGVYEFGTVEGADSPVSYNETVAVTSFGTVQSLGVNDQAVLGGDATMGDTDIVTLVAAGVLIDGPGWLVVHADNGEGAPGAVIGFAPVVSGFNADVMVELAVEDVTPVLFPMLHVDTGEENVYEFGTVEGADAPVVVDGEVLVTAITATPTITYAGSLSGTTLVVQQAVIDTSGWLVIHADNDGAPGMVIGVAPLSEGLNTNILVELDEENMTETVFPMLHYDTDELGVYEFGTVDGADGPVVVDGVVVTDSLIPESMMMEETEEE